MHKILNSYLGQYKHIIVRTHKKKTFTDTFTKSTQEKGICQEAKSYETITPLIDIK
jgi:hypothetical protein